MLLTAGVATGGTSLNAFDNALRAAGIADFNLIKVTSIVPPDIPISHLAPDCLLDGRGMMMPAVYESRSTARKGSAIAVAVGIGIPPQPEGGAGMVFVYSGTGSRNRASQAVKRMVDEGMRNKGYALHRFEVASAAMVVKKHWGTAFAAACFCDEDVEQLLPTK